MQDSFVYDAIPLALPAAAVKGYSVEKGRARPSSFLTAITGDGNVYTSADDMGRFVQALWAGRIVSSQRLAQACAPGRLDNGRVINDEGGSYGLGWEWQQAGKDIYVSHGGSWDGTSTALLINQRTKVAVVVLSNDENLDTDQIAVRIEKAVRALLPTR